MSGYSESSRFSNQRNKYSTPLGMNMMRDSTPDANSKQDTLLQTSQQYNQNIPSHNANYKVLDEKLSQYKSQIYNSHTLVRIRPDLYWFIYQS